MNSTKLTWVPQIVASALLLFWMIPGLPHGSPALLRIVCTAVFGYLAYRAYNEQKKNWMWAFGLVALIYNPLIPVSLSKDIRPFINGLAIVIALWSFKVFGEGKDKIESE